MTSGVDHLVIAASTLEEGVAWCERTLGITPGPGGEHPLMGTHNRLFSIASPQFPRAYFEIIAINKEAAYVANISARRWFDLDSEALQLQLKQNGPQLIHFVVSTPNAGAATQALSRLGIDRGELLTASRMTVHGLLAWQITVRNDGQRLMHGLMPTLIEWGDVHPSDHMVASGATLQSMTVSVPHANELWAAYDAIGLADVEVTSGSHHLTATLQTPLGVVSLQSQGI